jgi:hypothetical protein
VREHAWKGLPLLGLGLALLCWRRWKAYQLRHYEWILPFDQDPPEPAWSTRSSGPGAAVVYR